MMKEICIEHVQNGYVIECKYKEKPRASRGGLAEQRYQIMSRKVEHVATDMKSALATISKLMKKLSSGMDYDG